MSKLLNIAIPTYNRKLQVEKAIEIFISQIDRKYEKYIDIFISDDCSTDNTEGSIKVYSENYEYIHYRKYNKNIGLERNLIKATDWCDGKYLWIFGDDDFLDHRTALTYILSILKNEDYDFIILNRTRKSFDLSKNISKNWMELKTEKDIEYNSVKDFCMEWGIISVLGFISVNIFKRKKFNKINSEKYYGIMYPQLGAMLEAFHNSKCLLITKPLICHRTQTLEEKKSALGKKTTEKDFMSNYDRRDALYFSFNLIRFLNNLIECNAFTYNEISRMKEYVFSNIQLKDFLVRNIRLFIKLENTIKRKDILMAKVFFKKTQLNEKQKYEVNKLLDECYKNIDMKEEKLTITVITPSYNQAEFLEDCLKSVQNQTCQPIEHLVYDPGSTDGSIEIAKKYEHVTLINEKDNGQSDAVNKGLKRAKGKIIAWINSDDYYYDKDVFKKVIECFKNPEKPDIVYGTGIYVDEMKNKLRDVYINKVPSSLPWRLQQEDGILQPSVFLRREIFEYLGYLNENLHFSMDYEFWIRCMKKELKFYFLDQNLSVARYHRKNKTYGMRKKSYREVMDMLLDNFGYVNHVWLKRYAEYISDKFDGVLKHSENTKIKNKRKKQNYYIKLMKAYNTDYDVYNRIVKCSDKKGYGDTAKEMKKLNIKQPTPCYEIDIDKANVKNHICYTVGNRRYAFKKEWKIKQIKKTHNLFKKEINNRKKDLCIIVGNGPSLNDIDLEIIKEQDIIASNNIFLNKKIAPYIKYYTVANYLVAEQGFQHINLIENASKIIPIWLSYCIKPTKNTFFIDASAFPEFSKNIFKNISWRHTISFFNMQLAYGLGYRKVLLIGFDHEYKQSENVKEGQIILSDEDDTNHFSPEYFKGKKWQAADVNRMEEMYQLAKIAFSKNGKEIINCGVGGKLNIFQRSDLEYEIKKKEKIKKGISIYKDNYSYNEQQENIVGPYERKENNRIDECAIAQIFLNSIENRKTMIDVGAHHGHALMPYAIDGWKIHAFEPDPINRKQLKERISKFKEVKINKYAVSNKNEKNRCFYNSKESTGISSLLNFNPSHKEVCKVDTISLEKYIEDQRIEDIDLLKIDTEGNDLNVLRGFPWEKIKPTVIIAEFEDRKTHKIGYDFHDIANFIWKNGYQVYVSEWHPIIRYGIDHDWCRLTKYPCELISSNAWGNLIAIKEDLDEQIINNVIQNYFGEYEKERKSIKARCKMQLQKIKQNYKINKEKTLNRCKVIYAQTAEYILEKNDIIANILRYIIRSLRYFKKRNRNLFIFTAIFIGLCFFTSLFFNKYSKIVTIIGTITAIGISIYAAFIYGLSILINIKLMKDKEIQKNNEQIQKLFEIVNLFNEEKKELKIDQYKILEELKNIDDRIARIKNNDLKKINHEIDNMKDLLEKYDLLENEIRYYTKGTHQYFNRHVSQDFYSKLNQTGLIQINKMNQDVINYLGNYICNIERKSKGRFAGNIEDIILRNLFINEIKTEKIRILEIGTLFGIQLAILYNTCRGHFKKIKICAIDPLDGYYNKNNNDVLTNEPINEDIFFHNMRIADVAIEDIKLIKELSTNKTALAIAKENYYNVLVIDGDHSYEGVKFDFENYCDMVSKKGIIIFDDYMSEEWPGVTKYVDNEVKCSDLVEFVYADYRTAIFKKV